MSDPDLSLVLEPVRLPFSERLFSAAHREALPDGTEALTDLDRAMLLENSQELPPEYRIWQDVQANAVSPFYCTDAYATISTDIEEAVAPFWEQWEPIRMTLVKRRLRKTQTEFENFVNTLLYDAVEQLKQVSAARHCLSPDGEPVLEALFRVYHAGFYPCGWRRDNNIVCFDPSVLEGHWIGCLLDYPT
ncbi:hypothetical protein B5T_03081 [Alloalcanivorax dieselolei B5]|uniref:Uncharacterized protein n=1 Tax=Alcanivorax dieselolei (strain DSM 16502 / CGMCC 1.3690 / MCCC 1A00001 / B-5) TaxID=930169 RepID=K0CFC5_ALCDB|nr:hypothetical protein [Alloalcanivorax dieselolei]AFT71348.1 hypothetical protein B5T_03081 [Alloalcanivorax dieselolei B5]GGJ95014.1 hypothetical protein GCM10007426_25030 [Alloalcanivorax dieselolei]